MNIRDQIRPRCRRARRFRAGLALLGVVLFTYGAAGEAAPAKTRLELGWGDLPALPNPEGVAGAFVGTHRGVLMVAGGANFPEGKPWEGGTKVWHDRIHVLQKTSGDAYAWLDTPWQLPRALAYGVSISTDQGVLCIGGNDADQSYAEVYLLTWDPEAEAVEVHTLPSLPEPLANMGGARLGNAVYLVGGQKTGAPSRTFWRLSLAGDLADAAWDVLDDFPGPARMMPTVVAQNDGMYNCLYVFSGRTSGPLYALELFSDSWAYCPDTTTWTRKSDVLGDRRDGTSGVPAAAAPCVSIGAAHVLIFGGGGSDRCSLNQRIANAVTMHALGQESESETDPARQTDLQEQVAALEQVNRDLMAKDAGHRTEVLSYHTITDTWSVAGEMPPGRSVVAASSMWMGSDLVIASGETRPGVRTPALTLVTRNVRSSFGLVNYLVLVTYLGTLVGMGFFFSRRESSTDRFFLGGRRIPWWAAGLSIYATQLSAITFVSTPAIAFGQNWLTYLPRLTIFLMAPVVIFLYLPFFRRLNLTTAYEYLELRFNLPVRLFGSLSFIAFQLGRMGVVVYLPALALTTITGLDIYLSIVLMGLLSIVYTTLGGIEAVIWTDVLQVVVLLGGMLVMVFVIFVDMGGPGPVFQQSLQDGKFVFFDFSPSLRNMNSWMLFIGMFALQFGPYTTDQAVVQRYLTTKDEKAAARSIWTNGLISIPGSFLFFLGGTCLYAYFKAHPVTLLPGMAKDEVLPLFVSNHLPPGISGLVIAGIFAASMSSLDSSMHSVSTAVTTDFYRRFRPEAPDRRCLNVARWVTVVVGILGTAFACYLAGSSLEEMYFTFQKILGLVGSSLSGIFILGIFTRRANGPGALTGGVVASAVLIYVKYFTPFHFFTYAVIGIVTCAGVGYLASLVLPSAPRDLTGLSWHTRRKPRD